VKKITFRKKNKKKKGLIGAGGIRGHWQKKRMSTEGGCGLKRKRAKKGPSAATEVVPPTTATKVEREKKTNDYLN